MTAGFYFRHFAGFLIQLGLGMVLCFMPFDEAAFNCPRRRAVISCVTMALVFSAVFPLVTGLEIFRSYDLQVLSANLYMLAALLAFVFLYFYTLRPVETVKKLMVLLLALLYAAAQYLLVNFALSLFPGVVLPEIYPPLTLALYAGTAAVMFPPFALLMRRGVREYLLEMESGNIRREFGALIAMTVLYLANLMIYASSSRSMMSDFWWWIVPPLLLITAVLGIFYWTLFKESVRRKRDSDERRAMELQQLQYENITREMEQTRKMNHDMRHLLNRLRELAAQGDEKALQDYLSGMTEEVSHRDVGEYCKNETVNGLLQYYVGMAMDKDIQCRVKANCGDVVIAPADLTVLLGNIMENAIRSCQLTEGKRWISVEIGVIGGSMLVQTANPCQEVHASGKYRMDGEFLPASAYLSGRNGGGYGLHSVEHTAKKYGGDARFRFEEATKIFTTRVRLNLS